MIFNGKIRKLREHDISDILKHLPDANDPLWVLDTSRQTEKPQHIYTKNIRFVTVGAGWDGTAGKAVETKLFSEPLTNACMKVAQEIADVVGGVLNHVVLIMLPPGCKVLKHIDSFPLTKIHRCHVPIITNDQCEFTLVTTKVAMEVGSSYEINNQLPHDAENKGTTPRIHLLVDVFPNASN